MQNRVKYLLFFVNFVFMLACSAVMIAVGVIGLIDISAVGDILPKDFSHIPIYTLVMGTVTFASTFMGWYGAKKDNRLWIIIYAVIMSFLAAVSCFMAFFLLGHNPILLRDIEDQVTEAFNNSFTSGSFKDLEITFQCCGSSGADSYTTQGYLISKTCCPKPENHMCFALSSYRGCAIRFYEYLNSFSKGAGFGIVVINFIAVIAVWWALHMNRKIQKEKESTTEMRPIDKRFKHASYWR